MTSQSLNIYTDISVNMATITLSIPEDIRKQMKQHDEVNWSAFIRKQIVRKTQEIEKIEELKKRHTTDQKEVETFAVKLQRVSRSGRFAALQKKGLI